MKNKRTKLTALLLSALMAVSTISSVTWAADFSDGEATEVPALEEFVFSEGNDSQLEVMTEDVDDSTTTLAADPNNPDSDPLSFVKDSDGYIDYENETNKAIFNQGTWEIISVIEYGIPTYPDPDKLESVHENPDGTYSIKIDVNAKCTVEDPTQNNSLRYVKNWPIYRGHAQTVTADPSKNKSATCKEPLKLAFYFKLTDTGSEYVVYQRKGEPLKHDDGSISGRMVAIETLREDQGHPCEYYEKTTWYYVCPTCGFIKVTSSTSSSGFNYIDPASILSNGYVTLENGVYKIKIGNYANIERDKNPKGIVFTEDQTTPKGHNWVNKGLTVIPPDNYLDDRIVIDNSHNDRVLFVAWTASKFDNYTYQIGDDYPFAKLVEDVSNKSGTLHYGGTINGEDFNEYELKANCKITSDGVAGALYSDQDGYYYTYEQCTVCGKTRGVKVPLLHADMQEGSRYYLVGDNVAGFAAKDSNGNIYRYVDSNDNLLSRIPESAFYDAILGDCSRPGRYTLVEVGKNNSTITVDEFIKEGHTLGRIKLKMSGSIFNTNFKNYAYDGGWFPQIDLSSAANSVKESYRKHIKVDHDENYNVTAVYSKDCITEAYYELEQTCLGCNYRNSSVEGKKKAKVGDHVWENLGTDTVKIKYTQVDDQHHLEHYYDNVKCTLCNKKDQIDSIKTPDALKPHKFAPKEIKDTRTDPTCGENGYFKRADTCPCEYVDESTTTTVTLPLTDDHDFGTNPVELRWNGEAFIKNGYIDGVSFYVTVSRKCNICGNYDSNGINTVIPTKGDLREQKIYNRKAFVDNKEFGGPIFLEVDSSSIKPAKKDTNGVTLPCSTSTARVFVDWIGTVDGKVTELSTEKLEVPYYESEDIYRGRTSHRWDSGVRTNYTAPTETTDGECDIVYTCEVCGETKTVHQDIPKLDPTVVPATPELQAVSVGYNSISVTWNAVDGADHYRLYYKSADLGVLSWKLLKTVTGTSFTHTGLVTGAKYRYTVRAVQNGVKGDYNKKGSVATPKLSAPANISVTAVSGKNKVSWSKVDGANGYIIQRSTGSGWTRVGSVKKGAKVTWTDRKPVPGSTYRVRAYRTVNDANFSKNNVYSAFSSAK